MPWNLYAQGIYVCTTKVHTIKEISMITLKGNQYSWLQGRVARLETLKAWNKQAQIEHNKAQSFAERVIFDKATFGQVLDIFYQGKEALGVKDLRQDQMNLQQVCQCWRYLLERCVPVVPASVKLPWLTVWEIRPGSEDAMTFYV